MAHLQGNHFNKFFGIKDFISAAIDDNKLKLNKYIQEQK